MGKPLNVIDVNLHEIDVNGRSLLFHIPSTSLFERDALTGAILEQLRQQPQEESALVATLSEDYAEESVKSALFELQRLSLVSEDSSSGATVFEPLKLDSVPLTTVVLNVNTGCNLSCSYCYKEDLDTPQNQRKMELQTAIDSVEMLLSESPNQDRYNIVFFGGEPLSNLPLIKAIIDYAERRIVAELGRKVDFSLTTNATLLDEKTIDYLNQHRVGIAVSIDGPKAYHDRNRITVGGQGTYETVAKKVGLLLSRYTSRPVGARVTLTTGVTDIHTIWDHLFNNLGFAEVGFAPVTSGDIADYNLKPDELAAVFSGMKALGEKYLEAALNNRNIGFSNLHQLITDLHEGNKKALPCGAGVGMVAVDHEGGVNLCHRFTGSELPLLGDVQSGVDKAVLGDFLNARLDKTDTACATCHIRNLCAGGCYHESYARYGDPVHPTYHYCDLMRDWIDFGIYVYTTIMEHNPGFYDRYLAPRRAG